MHGRKTQMKQIMLDRTFFRHAQPRKDIQRQCFLICNGPVKRRQHCFRGIKFRCLLSPPILFLFLCLAASSSSNSLRSGTLRTVTDCGRRAKKSPVDESEVEIFLDQDGRIPGGILPDSPKPANLKYGFRSFLNYLNFTSLKVCPRGTLIPVICCKTFGVLAIATASLGQVKQLHA